MGSSSPQPQQVTSTSNSAPWADQQPYLKDVFAKAQALYNNQNMPQFYPGQTYAPTSGQSQAAAAYGTDQAIRTARGDYLDPSQNSGLNNLINSTIANTMPGIMSPYVAANRTGSGLYGRAIGEGIASGVAPLYQQERQNQIAAPGQLAQIGQAVEAYNQKPIDEAMARFNYEQNLPTAKLADYMQMVNGSFGGVTNTTGTQYIPRQNTLGSILGGLASGVGILGGTGAFGPAGWLSDERTKKDITPVGETFDGLPIYTYHYKWEDESDPKRMGVMAQEALETNPEAVGMTPFGLLAVDYDKLGAANGAA